MRILVLAVALFCATSQAVAQDAASIERLTRESLLKLVGTFSVQAHSRFANGQLSGCTIEYNVMAQDVIYKQGSFMKVNGSFGLMAARGQVAVVLKVLVNDVDTRTMSATPNAPATAYFIGDNRTTKSAIIDSYPGDTPGAILAVFKLDPTVSVILKGLEKNKVVIAFARKKGGTDIVMPVDTSVVDTRKNGERIHSPKPAKEFLDCSRVLLQQVIK